MSVLEDLTKENLQKFGIEGFSFTMPASTQKWVNENTDTPAIQFNAATLSLNYSANNWLAPFSGIINETNAGAKKVQYSLQKANGDMVNETGAVLRLFPQQILRLKRLVALNFEEENAHNPERAAGNVKRQVPAFIFIENGGATGMISGFIKAGTDIGFGGTLSFYDEQGYIIHPLYCIDLLKRILAIYPVLDIDTNNTLNNQFDHIISLTANSNTVRLVKPDGKPYSGAHITGMTVSDASIGLFTVDTYSGTDTSLKGELERSPATAPDGDFPPLKERQLLMGNICYGRLLNKVPLLKLPGGLGVNTLTHDFFTVLVVEMNDYLSGVAPDDFNATKLEPRPALRMHEQVEMLPTGNDIMGRLSTIFSGSPSESLCVGTALDLRLPLPINYTDVMWPAFPALPAGNVIGEENNSFPLNLKQEIKNNSRADFIPTGDGSQPTDVLLKLTGIPVGAAIRIFQRIFLSEAVVIRGDGAGGVCSGAVAPLTGRTLNGELSLVLKDPLGLKRPDGTINVPTDAKLIIDVMINLHENSSKRLFGAIVLPVQNSPEPLPAVNPLNSIDSALKKGVSNAAILGLQTTNITAIDLSSFDATLNTILALTGETQPRDASRHPTMVRRDLLAASKKTTYWEALISGGQINGNLHNALPDRACPGSPGGKETSNVGLYTQNGQLAYDIARMAFRRTTNFYERILQLGNPTWIEPAENTALNENDAVTADVGTFAGILLQNIAPECESPELAILKRWIEPSIDSIPATFDDLVTLVVGWINGIDTGLFSGLIQTAANKLKTTLVDTLNGLKDNNALSENDRERLYNELKRELSAACFGRRDTQWALKQAISNARRSIYIETPGFNFTKGETDANYAIDLIQEINSQLQAKPGLRVILCVPKKPDYQNQYDQWIRSEVKERYEIIQAMPSKQIVAFHPVGFPGRPANLEQHIVIVDDQWALLGSSAFRRRGLTFDGSSDLVFTDFDRSGGSAGTIAELRKTLMKQRLGMPADETTTSRVLHLEKFHTAFSLIRQTLVAGGLGKIERLWNGRTDGLSYIAPTIDNELANPEGIEFNSLDALVYNAFASLAK